MDIFDIFQQFRIDTLTSDISGVSERVSNASFKAGQASIDVKVLANKVDHLSLVCMAMCELLEEVGFNKSMLEQKIREIDLRDGKLDGKYVERKVCSGCGRELAERHVTCIYCGAKTS